MVEEEFDEGLESVSEEVLEESPFATDEAEVSNTETPEEAVAEQVSEQEETSSDSEENDEEGVEWYTLQCYSLHEHKVRDRIQQMLDAKELPAVRRVLLPEEETVEIKNNDRVEKISKMYPGYLFVQMEPDAGDWFRIKQLNGVLQFVGHKDVPTPISKKEIDRILRNSGDRSKKIEVDFEVDETIKVVTGPFRGYNGLIVEINPDRGKLKALISIFGRETPVELEFDHVEKVSGG